MSQTAEAASSPPADPTPHAPAMLPKKQLVGIIGALALGAFLMILNENVLTVARRRSWPTTVCPRRRGSG